jgi:hypothetical protein
MEGEGVRLDFDQAADCSYDCLPNQLQLHSKEDTAASADRQSWSPEFDSAPHTACKATIDQQDSAPSEAANINSAHAFIFDGGAAPTQDPSRREGETAPDIWLGIGEAEQPEVLSRETSCLSRSGWIRLLVKLVVLAGIVLVIVFAGQKTGKGLLQDNIGYG